MLQTLNFVGPRIINAKGTFFRYESGTAGGADESVRVRVDGQDLGLFVPGDSVELPGPVGQWEITPVNLTTSGIVRIGLGKVSSSRLSGTVRVVDEITDAIVSQGFTPALAVATIAYSPVIAAAANVRGLILRYWNVSARAAASGFASLQFTAAKSTPTSYNTPTQRYTIAGVGSLNGTDTLRESWGNKYLPPGWGVYIGGEVQGSPAQALSARIEYEVL